MTEQEWLASDDPTRMIEWIRLGNVAAEDDYPPNYPHCPVKISDHKLRLFACACFEHADKTLLDMSVGGGCDYSDYSDGISDLSGDGLLANVRSWVGRQENYDPPTAVKAAILRDIIGDPFRLVTALRTSGGSVGGQGLEDLDWQSPWLTPTVLGLARTAYEERGRKCLACNQWTDCEWCDNTRRIDDGSLQPDLLAILADALEDAGCDNADILRHCRGQQRCAACLGAGVVLIGRGEPSQGREETQCRGCQGAGWVHAGPHCRGCWVIDLLLGEE